jgi:hypothetical protein
MTTIALKKYLISKINLLEDDDVLSEIKEIVDKNEIVYQLSDYHLNRIEESRVQFENGEFYTQEEVNLQVEKWLNKK